MEYFYSLNRFLQDKFRTRIRKIAIDSDMTCPNMDATLSVEGCIYCDNRAFNLNVNSTEKKNPVKQLTEGIAYCKKRYKADKFIAYFQSYSNTYGSMEKLKNTYDIVRDFPEVSGISIGTRPDCIDNARLDLIESYTDNYFVMMEYGLQSSHEETLKLINRRHSVGDFIKAVNMTKNRNIFICVHLIIGLPGENREKIIETAKFISRLPINSVKLHGLSVVRGTKLEEMYNNNSYTPLEFNEYINLVCDFIEYIPKNIVIQRLTADSPYKIHVAPKWARDKIKTIKAINDEFERRKSYQGIKCVSREA